MPRALRPRPDMPRHRALHTALMEAARSLDDVLAEVEKSQAGRWGQKDAELLAAMRVEVEGQRERLLALLKGLVDHVVR